MSRQCLRPHLRDIVTIRLCLYELAPREPSETSYEESPAPTSDLLIAGPGSLLQTGLLRKDEFLTLCAVSRQLRSPFLTDTNGFALPT